MVVVGCDPGLRNFAISIVSIKNTKCKVLHAAMLQHPITSLKDVDLPQQRLNFIKEVTPILKKYRPKLLVIERFMVRGRFGQSIAECVAFMLGILSSICAKLNIKFRAITSATWKNSFHRALQRKLDSLYYFMKPVPPHIVDSILQATYGVNPKFENFNADYLKKVKRKWQN